MSKKILIIGIIVFTAIVFTAYIFSADLKSKYGVDSVNDFSNIKQECTNRDGYCVYDNVPYYMKYSSPPVWIKQGELDFPSIEKQLDEVWFWEDEVWQNLVDAGMISQKDVPKEANLSEVSKYLKDGVCVETGKEAIVIKYFYDLCEGKEGMMGCGHERSAIVCGDVYFVYDFTSSFGPRYYGPYYLPTF